jgi:GAF domain-containing protein
VAATGKRGRKAPPQARRKRIAPEKSAVARLGQELAEARAQQAATAEILKVIASSPSDVQPVFEAIVQSAKRLIGGLSAAASRVAGDELHLVAFTSTDEAGDEALRKSYPRPTASDVLYRKSMKSRGPAYVSDTETDPDYSPELRQATRARGYRSVIGVPILRDGAVIGRLNVTRREPGAFSDHQIDLLKTFADQAVIAIENVRLFNETRESLERQTATAEILKVIASSPSDVQPVFHAIADSALRLLGGHSAAVRRIVGDMVHLEAYTSTSEAGDATLRSRYPMPLKQAKTLEKMLFSGAPTHIADTETDPEYASPAWRETARARGFRSLLAVPLLREGAVIGSINVSHQRPGAFTDRHTGLLKTFADQAVIAIENVRLFNETREALERQTATAEILRVIAASPSNVQPVFESIAASALRLCRGSFSVVSRVEGDLVHLAAMSNVRPEATNAIRGLWPVPLGRKLCTSRAISERRAVQIPDVREDPEYDAGRADELAGFRAVLAVPMLRDGKPIGAINVNRAEPGQFPEDQVSLLTTFADQAVIAIENVRLFNETKEALERQTATGEILASMSGSMTNAQPVFDTIARNLLRLFGTEFAIVAIVRDDRVEIAGIDGAPGFMRLRERYPVPLNDKTHVGKVILEGKVSQLVPIVGNPAAPSSTEQFARELGYDAQIGAPMIREGTVIGAIIAARRNAMPFDDKQVALIKSFADQAVIAIENVRLFNETKEALERQTATAEILKVIASSPSDVQPVFDAIVKSGLNLFSGAGVGISIVEGGELRVVAAAGGLSGIAKGIRLPISRESASGMAIVERRVVNIKDTEAPDAPPHARDNGRKLGVRSMTQAPMFREGEAIGVIGVTLKEPGGLDDKQISLLQTFADQAVIAIENVRLFKELQSRTEALTKSVGQLTALGEVGQAISSTLDLETVLQTIVQHAVKLTGLDGGSIYEYDEARGRFSLQAAENIEPELVTAVRERPVKKGEGAIGRCAETLEPEQVADIADGSYTGKRKHLLVRAGYRAILAVPLLREDHLLGALQVFRKSPGPFAPEVVELMKTFATQSAMAIQNARLYREIAEKGKQLEVASQHKSQFLASMSHELRTPLNAILGFNEMLLGQVYGEVPGDMQEPMQDIQKSGKHLLRLINNVLDLAKIEAGRMELSLADYSVQDTVTSVQATLRPLAAEKGLEFIASVPEDIPLGHGDGGRLAQCLMNLAGNSLKFTKQGKVEIAVVLMDGLLRYSVRDTGIGIPADKIDSLFTEFKQTDAAIASEYGGTGLGLSISKKFIEMHGGRIWVESEVGKGSAFIFELPLRVKA